MPKKELRDRKREPTAPAQMVRAKNPGSIPAKKEDDKLGRSPLGMYIKMNHLSLNSFARALGADFRSVQQWAYGEQEPTLAYALEIERVTKGVVAVEIWAGVGCVRERIAQIRERQDDGVRRIQNENEPGGFSAPTKGRKGDPKAAERFKKGGQKDEPAGDD
jgi:hypothetical protein